MILWYLLVGHVVGLLGTTSPPSKWHMVVRGRQSTPSYSLIFAETTVGGNLPLCSVLCLQVFVSFVGRKTEVLRSLVRGTNLEIRCSEQARLLKTVKDHGCDS